MVPLYLGTNLDVPQYGQVYKPMLNSMYVSRSTGSEADMDTSAPPSRDTAMP